MPQAVISSVRQGRGCNMQPRRGRSKMSYPTEFKREVCRLAEEWNLKCGGKLQAKVHEKLLYKLSF